MSWPGRRYDAITFDAMGVLYRSRDDVAELLIPYARSKGSTLDAEEISSLYTECSLGRFGSAELWRALGTADADDVEYCQGHELSDGVPEVLGGLSATGIRLACLSNDVSAWSAILRARFGLDKWIPTWVISGDIGVRKPAPGAYRSLCAAVHADAARVLLVDDRLANVEAARRAGLSAVWFGADAVAQRSVTTLPVAADMAMLLEMAGQWT